MENLQYWFAGALEDIFSDTVPYHFSPMQGYVDMAQNEGESLQLALRADTEKTVRVKIEPFAGENAPRLEYGLIGFAFASEQSYDIGQKVLRRKTPCDFPEYIQTMDTITLQPHTSRSYFITAWTTPQTKPGEYRTVIRLTADGQEQEIPLAVRVRAVQIPEAIQSDYAYTCWVNLIGMTPVQKSRPNGLVQQNEVIYGIRNYSEEFWKLAANFARAMKRERQNVITVPFHELLLPGMRFAPDGSYLLDFTLFDRYVETFMQNGAYRYLEGYHLFFRDFTYDPPAPGEWSLSSIVCWVFEQDEEGAPAIGWRLVKDPDTEQHLRRLLIPLYAHLREKGWDTIWLQHVADEMTSDIQLQETLWGYQMVHACMPGIRTIDAVSERSIEFFGEELNIHVPILYAYEDGREEMHAFARKHDNVEIWDYTCMLPHQDYLSRLGDYKLICTRLLHWYNFKTGATGYLHWGWNIWSTGKIANKPFEDTCTVDGGYATDAWLVFPDVENLDVLETVRSHANRDGLEDRELLRIAMQKAPQEVEMLLNVMLVNSKDYDLDPNTFMRIRTELLNIAERP